MLKSDSYNVKVNSYLCRGKKIVFKVNTDL